MRSAARFIIAGILLAFVAALLPQRAEADAYTYSTTRRVFKVGNLLLDSTVIPGQEARGPENPDPYVFYIADARTDLKPLNWEFTNPLAPKVVTPDIYTRWQARHGGTPPYTHGQTVTKDMAAYWEVFLSRASLEELLQFDLLFITSHLPIRFTPEEREKLRKLVDAGGIVWIEDCGSMNMDPDRPFFLDQLQFARDAGGTPGPVINAPNHPLLNSPYRLTYQEIANLGDKNYGGYYMHRAGFPNQPPHPDVLINIVGNSAANGLPYIAAGNYGSGAVIATAGDSGCDINDYAGGVNVGSGGNSGAFSGRNIQTAHSEDLKFLYNLVAWGSAANTERRNNRRTAASFDAVGAPLLERFDFTKPGTPPASVVDTRSAPLIVKEVAFVSGKVGGNAVLRAYDLQPSRDLDSDGNPDDGIPDLVFGAPYDEIWRSGDLGSSDAYPSAPTYATVAAGGTIGEAIFVTLGTGALVAFPAYPRDNGGRLLPSNAPVYTNAPTGGGGGGYVNADGTPGVAPSPLFYEGRVYVTEPDGRVRCVRAGDGTTLFRTSNDAQPFVATGSPTMGFVRHQPPLTGAAASVGGNMLDLVLYQPVRDTGGSPAAGHILAYWLGSRNDVVQRAGNTFSVFAKRPNTRLLVANAGASDGPPFITPTVRIYASNDPQPNTTARENYQNGNASSSYNATIQRDGTIQVTRTDNPSAALPADLIVVADYDLLYVTNSENPGITGSGSRHTDAVLRTRGTAFEGGLETVALSPDDLLVYAARERGTPDSAGNTPAYTSVFATNEQAIAGGTKSLWRFTLHEGYGTPTGTQPVLVNGQSVSDAPVLLNTLRFHSNWPRNDEALTLPPAQVESLRNLEPVGAPIVTNDGLTYVLVRGVSVPVDRNQPQTEIPVTALLAFRTNLQTVLNVGPMANNQVVVAQADRLTPGGVVTLQPSQYVVDPARGRITITSYQPLAGGGAAASASQPFVVTTTPAGTAAQVTTVFTPVAANYTPLLWYYVVPGHARSAPSLVGDHIYFLSQTPGASGTSSIIAVEADPAGRNPAVKRAQQVTAVVATLDTRPQQINHVRWARALEGAAGASVDARALTGAQGALLVASDRGSFAFEDAITLIADGKRLVEARADGSAVWVLDSTVKRTIAGGETPLYTADPANPIANPPATGRVVTERKSISRPATARRLTQSDLLIADTGNNRVVRVDRGGGVLWDLERVSDPYGILASGDPVTLSGPTDVHFWTVYNYNNGQITGYEAHYLIADAGNFRLIEVVDYYDAQGNVRDAPGTNVPGERVLVWTTRTASKEGRRIRFQSVERFIGPEGVPIIVAVAGNLRAAGTDATATADFTGGALVQVNYRPYQTLFRPVGGTPYQPWPDAPPGQPALSTEPADNGLLGASVDDLIMPDGTIKRITRPLYFQQVTRPGGTTAFLLCDADGVFEFEPRLQGGRIVRVVTWAFTQEDYNRINFGRLAFPVDPSLVNPQLLPRFLPSSVRRMGSGNYLITNSFTGGSQLFGRSMPSGSPPNANGQFLGEVFEVRPTGEFAEFSVPRIVRETVTMQDSMGNNVPVGVRNRQQMGESGNTTVLEQPLFSDRLY